MRLLLLLSLPALLSLNVLHSAHESKTGLQTVSINGHNFTLPIDFEIQLVAKAPLVDRPITMDIDEQGRLYVADSSGSNENVQEQRKKKPHRILRLEDTNNDGIYDKSVVFADQMMFPEGTMWYNGSLYVCAPPEIWKLTDTDNDGVADKREVWFDAKTLTGCANDLHGPYLGPDGWIYWTKGAFAKQTYDLATTKWTTRAAHIFRARADGSHLEPVMTGGMDNPVDVVHLSNGDRIFTTTFFQHPANGQRDGLVHAFYGAIFGKDHDVIYEHPWTSPKLSPVLTHMGPAAPSGLHRYQSTRLGKEFQNNLFACQFNMRKISRHIVKIKGSGYETSDSDFLVSDQQDFHPTDVIEDIDGSLLVIDTGGWYKICCPTSQLVKPDILGGIYRIQKKGNQRFVPTKPIDWKADLRTLKPYLNDPRLPIRTQALATFASRSQEAIPILQAILRESKNTTEIQNAVFALCAIDDDHARSAIRSSLNHADESVQQVALYGISLWKDVKARTEVEAMLSSGSATRQRLCAEALGRIADRQSVPALLLAMEKLADVPLETAILFALIQIQDSASTAKGLLQTNPRVQRAALIALDQMKAADFEAKVVLPFLNATDAALNETAWWIVSRHPEWGASLAQHFATSLQDTKSSVEQKTQTLQRMARFIQVESIQQIFVGQIQKSDLRKQALQALSQIRVKETPKSLYQPLAMVLNDPKDQLDTLRTLRSLPNFKPDAGTWSSILLEIAKNPKQSNETRLLALVLHPDGLTNLPSELLSFLCQQLVADQTMAIRSLAVDVLLKCQLQAEQGMLICEALKKSTAGDVNRLLPHLVKSNHSKMGLALIDALKCDSIRTGLRLEDIQPHLAKFDTSVQTEAEKLYSLIKADTAQQRAKLDSLLADLSKGDIRRGQAVFNSTKAACITCHNMGYVGGKAGPDLTRIGSIRSERDLLEAIVYPSASFVRSYEPVRVETKSGKTYNGTLKKDAPDEMILTLNATEEVCIPREEIEEWSLSKVSIMPAGLDQQLTAQELIDLVVFLKAAK